MSALDIEVIVVGLLYGACVESLPALPQDCRLHMLTLREVYWTLVMFLPETWEPHDLYGRRRLLHRGGTWKA